MTAIYKRELKSYFNGVSGYLFCAFILLFAGIYTMAVNLHSGSPNFEYAVANIVFIYLLAIPVLTMKSVSEERKQRTDLLLYSLPVSMTKIILGKYLAMLTVLALPIAVMAIYPLILMTYGTVNLAVSYATLFGFFLLGATLTALGMFISSLTENQTLSAILSVGVILVIYNLGALADFASLSPNVTLIVITVSLILLAFLVKHLTKSLLLAVIFFVVPELAAFIINGANRLILTGVVPKIMEALSVFDKFYNFANGIFDITSVVYFVAVSAVLVFLTVQSMEKRRWS